MAFAQGTVFAVQNSAPTVGSISPSSGLTQKNVWKTFTCIYSDLDGASDIATCYLAITKLSPVWGAYIYYSKTTDRFYIKNMKGEQIGGVQRGTPTTIENESVILDCGGTSVTVGGNTITVAWRIQFKPSMMGQNCNLYLQARDKSAVTSGWIDKGDFSVNGAPTTESILPCYGNTPIGVWKTYTCSYSDPNGVADLATCYLLINASTAPTHGAYLYYSKITDKFYMKNNAYEQVGGILRGTATTIETEGASLDCSGTTITTVGNRFTITWRILFKPPMAGKQCKLYMQANDKSGSSSGWISKGDYNINAPSSVSISPDSGDALAGVWRTFTCTYSNPNGVSNFATCYLLINKSTSPVWGAYLYYSMPSDKFYIKNNTYTQVGIPRGTATTIESESAILDCAATTVTASGNNLTIAWRIQFKSTMQGEKYSLYLQASDKQGSSSGWVDKGDFTVRVPGEMVFIPAGSFLMGNNGSEPYSDDVELPQHSVYLHAYYIGKYEVTRGEYRAFMDAGAYTNSSYWSTDGWNWKGNRTEPDYWAAYQDWDGLDDGIGSFVQTDSHPVVGVSYYEAEAYCNWARGYLPTEAEWEKAARWTGGHANVYPWGDTWDEQKCNNWSDSLYQGYQTAPVGSYPDGASPYGCQDMAGNVHEWTRDGFASYPESENPFDYSDIFPVMRGGDWAGSGDIRCRCANRFVYGLGGKDKSSMYGGFRLVWY